MKLWSDSFKDGTMLATRYAAGSLDVQGFAPNINPSFAWDDVPEGTKSFVLICTDLDAPVHKDILDTHGQIAATTPRHCFYHWAVIHLPANLRSIGEGEFSQAFVLKGKPGPQAAYGSLQGLNDYTNWSAKDGKMCGKYFGYDGPYPPANDAIPHRYIFTLYALAVEQVDVPLEFTCEQAQMAMEELKKQGLITAQASITGLYTLNQRLLDQKYSLPSK